MRRLLLVTVPSGLAEAPLRPAISAVVKMPRVTPLNGFSRALSPHLVANAKKVRRSLSSASMAFALM